ncbi:MAG: sodium:calcium antiporter [Acidimicrobiia bacterium]
MGSAIVDFAALVAGVAIIVWGAETFAEHLAAASARLGVTTFALALLLAGAEPEELATAVAATLRDAPAVAFGDVIGANAAICLVALGVGGVLAPLPFGTRVRRYALFGLPVGVVSVAVAWDGRVARGEGALLVLLYAGYVAAIWVRERRPPSLGETVELDEEHGSAGSAGRELALVLAGLAGMVVGATLLVEGVRGLAHSDGSQARLSLTIVGFATAFELVVLAWSAARRGISEAVVAAVVGSFAYNATMTLGVAALVQPLRISDAGLIRAPAVAMLTALALPIVLARCGGELDRRAGVALLVAYPAFIALSVAT